MWAERYENKLLSSLSKATIALTQLKSHRPCRREATRRRSATALAPPGTSSFMARLTTANKASANKANRRDQAWISVIRAWAKPSSHLTSRNPSSQPKRRAYSAAVALARRD